MRRSVVSRARWMGRRGVSGEQVAERLSVPRTTVSSWTCSWRRDRCALQPRGRPPRQPTREERTAVLHVLGREGSGVGIPELRERFPAVAWRELEELRSRHARVVRRREARKAWRLEWTRPGAVWAADFTQAPSPVDGCEPRIQLVRDLGSQAQLLAMPARSESAAEVTLVLEQLFLQHGPPLVLKQDNGSGFIAEATLELCRKYGVLVLFSPPYYPRYNGACEAGVGSIKRRATCIAAGAGRPGAWTSDDVEAARLQANQCVRLGGSHGPSPEDLWCSRSPILQAERAAFQASYRHREERVRTEAGTPLDFFLNRAQQAIIDRAAIPAALVQHGYLKIRRGELLLTFRR